MRIFQTFINKSHILMRIIMEVFTIVLKTDTRYHNMMSLILHYLTSLEIDCMFLISQIDL